MFVNKYKKLLKVTLIIPVALFMVAGSWIVYAPPASAAAARCYHSLATDGKATSCAKMLGPVQGGGFKADKCYTTRLINNTFTWVEADCSIPPFNLNYQSVKCANGEIYESAQEYLGVKITDDMICADHGGTIITPSTTSTKKAPISCVAKTEGLNKSNCGIIDWLVRLINIMGGLVGIIVVGVIIFSGIQYSAAGNDPQKLASARNRILNALLAMAIFIFMFAFLQWLVPGGIF